ncbi:TPA: SURF1 family protein [Burkholderia vietnamiensis]|uniref:SURF1-like protein n=2 Tax=Burkholderia vietnamiensis TaxID=60552 RepID=A0AA45BCJ0_BURVI|nr:SURF1 family protein [Burkholderia vietnamiensis]MBR8205865.1 SURF1 family protein [Burkholderia vietnamiensis]PRH41715.1 SURF1 family protein [Burkholderia vietnamiensis]HDR8961505.1 SURF1 family protein [Burkholderia vietnamiensis]HDR8974170.1 SURF1 family protein [Burkholderia vietnamiensis]
MHDTNRTTAIRQEADNYRTSLSRLRPVGGAMKIRWLPALLILAVVAAAIRLGFWQRDRAHQKEALQADIVRYEHAAPVDLGAQPVALASIEFHRVRAKGRFMPEQVVFLDNRPYNDQPGFYVVMPFKLAGGGVVLVNRGWLPRNIADRTAIEPFSTPAGDIEIEGIARADASRAFELGEGGSAAHQKIRQNLDVAAYAKETGLPLQPFVIQQTSDDGDRLVRDWPAATTGVERNYGYMFQWWGIAAAALGFGLYAARRAAKKSAGA